jgi:hypothetical protein
MPSLEDQVLQVVLDFIKDEKLFTALDVSNKVKETSPHVRHKEVRDIVRDLFVNEMQPLSYTRSDIKVTLPNGSTTTAILYHHLSDSWSLDKYDDQQRAQSAVHNSQTANQTVVPTPAPVPVTPTPVSSFSTATPVTNPTVTPSAPDWHSQWMNIFNSKPSLFPNK